jgi:formylglycine-generating enzyme required for sulfatase activity
MVLRQISIIIIVTIAGLCLASCEKKKDEAATASKGVFEKESDSIHGGEAFKLEEDGEMVFVPKGVFKMGSNFGNPDEAPIHNEYLDDFRIDKFELTNRRYGRCVKAGVCSPANNIEDTNLNGARQPVVGLSWKDCVKFCQWEGKRLPTEAQWEKAARGTDGRKYPWGDEFEVKKVSCKGNEDGIDYTAPVGSFVLGASPYGAMDMAGNVKEFVNDWYDSKYYKTSPEKNPPGPSIGEPIPPDMLPHRVAKGGSWKNDTLNLRPSLRNPVSEGTANDYFGCRCAADAMPINQSQ